MTLTAIFAVGDWVEWQVETRWPELMREDYALLVIEFGFGPFKVERTEKAHGLGKIPPSHPQILTVSSGGKNLAGRFSGVYFRKIH